MAKAEKSLFIVGAKDTEARKRWAQNVATEGGYLVNPFSRARVAYSHLSEEVTQAALLIPGDLRPLNSDKKDIEMFVAKAAELAIPIGFLVVHDLPGLKSIPGGHGTAAQVETRTLDNEIMDTMPLTSWLASHCTPQFAPIVPIQAELRLVEGQA